jgi:hypothetical protein
VSWVGIFYATYSMSLRPFKPGSACIHLSSTVMWVWDGEMYSSSASSVPLSPLLLFLRLLILSLLTYSFLQPNIITQQPDHPSALEHSSLYFISISTLVLLLSRCLYLALYYMKHSSVAKRDKRGSYNPSCRKVLNLLYGRNEGW